MRISDWSSDVCSSDLCGQGQGPGQGLAETGWRRSRTSGGRGRTLRAARRQGVRQGHGGDAGPDSGGRAGEGGRRDRARAGARACPGGRPAVDAAWARSEEHTSELQSLLRISYAVFCLKKKRTPNSPHTTTTSTILDYVH